MADPEQMSQTWTIPQLTEWVNAVLRESLGDEIWIEGEISNLQRSAAGHVYFTLVEARPDPTSNPTPAETAQNAAANRQRGAAPQTLSVTLFDWHRKNVNRHLTRSGGGVRMSDGVRVRIRGSVEIYGARSQIQLKMSGIDPVFTLGTLAAERDALIARLHVDGLLTRNRGLTVAPLPTRIAVVTSIGSAAHADALHELTASGIGFELLVIDSRVQGAGAARSLIAALGLAADAEVDIIAIVRGGGARTDLAVFDREDLARAVALSPIPVWVGLGHETDRSVLDELAHETHKTPTACAAAIVDRASRGRETIYDLWESIDRRAATRLIHESTRLDRIGRRIAHSSTGSLETASARLARNAARVERFAFARLVSADDALRTAATSLRRGAPRRIAEHERRISGFGSTLKAYDPRSVLARGFSITRLADGSLVRAVPLPPGTRIHTTLAGGTVESSVIVVAGVE